MGEQSWGKADGKCRTLCPPSNIKDSSPVFCESDIGRIGCGDDVLTLEGPAYGLEACRGGAALGSSAF